ncbi:nitrate- and nitrite sensing domain-containing protein [Nonomuraea dietziae]|uniref:nitrate- and nitrite sensing domain-containing protein n=1 Tax=Nonomuraea dietziae TaxID=65515 RepID=UPI0031D670A0
MLLSLAALWSFAAWVTLREGVNLLWVAQLDSSVVGPSEPLLVELQRERRASMIQLGERSPRSRKELQDQRQRADRTKAEFETSARAGIVEWAVDDLGEKRLADMFAKLDDLASIRQAVDAGRVTRIEASAAYADVIDSVYRMYGAMATLDDKTLAGDIRTLMALSKAREILAREDALLAGALAQGRLNAEEHEQFTRTVGAWHIVAEQARIGAARCRSSGLRQADQGQVVHPAARPRDSSRAAGKCRRDHSFQRRAVEGRDRAGPDRLQRPGARRGRPCRGARDARRRGRRRAAGPGRRSRPHRRRRVDRPVHHHRSGPLRPAAEAARRGARAL